jgi:hypothetical protein
MLAPAVAAMTAASRPAELLGRSGRLATGSAGVWFAVIGPVMGGRRPAR